MLTTLHAVVILMNLWLVARAAGADIPFVVVEDKLVDEDVLGILDSGLEGKRNVHPREAVVVMVIDKAVLEDVDTKGKGHAVQAIHELRDVVVRDGGGLAEAGYTEGENRSCGHCAIEARWSVLAGMEVGDWE